MLTYFAICLVSSHLELAINSEVSETAPFEDFDDTFGGQRNKVALDIMRKYQDKRSGMTG
jgi:hypothetical protein